MSYNLVLATQDATVVAEYTPEKRSRMQYQSEAELERAMIDQLISQGYEYLGIHTPDDLVKNLRSCLEELNQIQFTDDEWERFFKDVIANRNDGIEEKTLKIQRHYVQSFVRDDGSTKNIRLIDKQSIHRNKLQVINQYATTGNHDNRYDVTILVNGFPLVHCELKRRGVPIKEAFNQIDRYQRDSFWADSGLYEYVQIFVISNGTHTKYYSNTTRFNVVEEANGRRRAKKTGSSSFEFTSYWADVNNQTIEDIVDFTKTFFARHSLLNILIRFCVFTEDRRLLVMRPYQIAATEKILNQIVIADNYNRWGSVAAGGYIWHTTGSGKTLTSFKTAQLVSELECVDKVLFVVDRQALDYQTMKEYDRFQQGAANGTKNTHELEVRLSDDSKIIVTTIQKLGRFIANNISHSVYNKRVVMIFDECHRSQFGEQHVSITRRFKRYALFGFTGTPIFATNSGAGKNPNLRTTEQAFGQKLHTYTVVNAIADKNVLPFRIDYVNTVRDNKGDDTLIEAIDDEAILLAPDRVCNVVEYILQHFDQKTMQNAHSYEYKGVRRKGFNSIFAVSSINAAKVYYEEFKRHDHNLKIGIIYSYGVNSNDNGSDYLIDEDSDSTAALSVDDRAFLEQAIADYNDQFGTQYDGRGTLFQNYYKNLSERMKNREMDILIVVNMFLTGFDAVMLNTLWVDKNLRMHGLIQAFSRTNRILNDVKAYGNIICFRNLRKEVDDAIALFGDKGAKGVVILKAFSDYYDGYEDVTESGESGKYHPGYRELVERLYAEYPLPLTTHSPVLLGESAKKEFIKLFGSILRLRNILNSFDDFAGKEILTDADRQDYISVYSDLHSEFKVVAAKDDVSADIVFEMELVKQVVVNIDYILELVAKYYKEHQLDKEIPVDVARYINANPELRPKRELIERFIQNLQIKSTISDEWVEFKRKEMQRELDVLITTGVNSKPLNAEQTHKLVDKMFRNGDYDVNDAELVELLPPLPRRFGTQAREAAKQSLRDSLRAFFQKYYD